MSVAINKLPVIASTEMVYKDATIKLFLVPFDKDIDANASIWYDPYRLYGSMPEKGASLSQFMVRIYHEIFHMVIHEQGMNCRSRGRDYTDKQLAEEDVCNIFASFMANFDNSEMIKNIAAWFEDAFRKETLRAQGIDPATAMTNIMGVQRFDTPTTPITDYDRLHPQSVRVETPLVYTASFTPLDFNSKETVSDRLVRIMYNNLTPSTVVSYSPESTSPSYYEVTEVANITSEMNDCSIIYEFTTVSGSFRIKSNQMAFPLAEAKARMSPIEKGGLQGPSVPLEPIASSDVSAIEKHN